MASYLVFYLNIDWRVGADWFESLLLDHDVCSNYGGPMKTRPYEARWRQVSGRQWPTSPWT